MALQIKIFRRDKWLCYWCKRPVVFSPVMKLLEADVKDAAYPIQVAYHHPHGTRDGAPLLDELGASIDHVQAFAIGGVCNEENLRTSCWKCNVRKSAERVDKWEQRGKRKPINGKYGEPEHWDGFVSVFVILAERNPQRLTAREREWLKALKFSYSPQTKS